MTQNTQAGNNAAQTCMGRREDTGEPCKVTRGLQNGYCSSHQDQARNPVKRCKLRWRYFSNQHGLLAICLQLLAGLMAILTVIGLPVELYNAMTGKPFLDLLGDPTPTATATPTPTLTPTSTRTHTPTSAATPLPTLTPTPTVTVSSTPTLTPVPTLTRSPDFSCSDRTDGDTHQLGDGATLVYVSAGKFIMGANDKDPDARNEEKPQHEPDLNAFWIYKFEVTNTQYALCVEAGFCEETKCEPNPDYDDPHQPVGCVTWHDAARYATWVGGRLPTEAEWEKTARGTDGRIYPWGNTGLRREDGTKDCSKAAVKGCASFPQSVGSYPDGETPYGALDMAGNLFEWTGDLFSAKYYSTEAALNNPQGPRDGVAGAKGGRVLRGGAFTQNLRKLRCSDRRATMPSDYRRSIGFRVVVGCGSDRP